MRKDHHIAAVIWALVVFGCAVFAGHAAFLLLLIPLGMIYLNWMLED